jgi:hypothetical protein
VAAKDLLTPHLAVPGLPGAMSSLVHKLLFDSFQASACSRPPEPSSKIFIGSGYGEWRSSGKNVKEAESSE